jgi:hypothetical protein
MAKASQQMQKRMYQFVATDGTYEDFVELIYNKLMKLRMICLQQLNIIGE